MAVQHLRGAVVRFAEHSHFAVRIGQRGSPLHGVVAVLEFHLEGIPFALRAVTAAHVLSHHHVAVRRTQLPNVLSEVQLAALVVRRPYEQHREFAFGLGPVDVREQRHSVAHPGGDSSLHDNLVVLRGAQQGACPSQADEKDANHMSLHGSPLQLETFARLASDVRSKIIDHENGHYKSAMRGKEGWSRNSFVNNSAQVRHNVLRTTMSELPSQTQMAENNAVPRLKRVLKLRDLIYYGIVFVSPIAPVPIFGVAQALSHGHAVTTILLAGVAMLLTAVSYGRMASLYPSAGSAYAYVGRGLNAHLGFLAGWAMSIDYIVIPMIAVIQATLAVVRLVPSVPYAVWAGLFVAFMTGLNLRGIRTTAKTNGVLLVCMFVVIGFFIALAVRYLFLFHGWHGLLSVQPFYDPPPLISSPSPKPRPSLLSPTLVSTGLRPLPKTWRIQGVMFCWPL